jgi:hypothetical protein
VHLAVGPFGHASTREVTQDCRLANDATLGERAGSVSVQIGGDQLIDLTVGEPNLSLAW